MKTRLLAIALIAGLLAASPAWGLALKFAPGGGAVWAVGKEIDASDIGYSFGGAVEAEVWKGFDYGIKYSYSAVSADWINPAATDSTPATFPADFTHHAFGLTNSWSPGWKWVDPYVRGAAGLYLWQQLDEDGNAYEYINPEDSTVVNELSATSFGISLGGGVRIWPFEFAGLRLGLDYDLVFSENRTDFGTHDANDNLLRVGAELIFRVPLK